MDAQPLHPFDLPMDIMLAILRYLLPEKVTVWPTFRQFSGAPRSHSPEVQDILRMTQVDRFTRKTVLLFVQSQLIFRFPELNEDCGLFLQRMVASPSESRWIQSVHIDWKHLQNRWNNDPVTKSWCAAQCLRLMTNFPHLKLYITADRPRLRNAEAKLLYYLYTQNRVECDKPEIMKATKSSNLTKVQKVTPYVFCRSQTTNK